MLLLRCRSCQRRFPHVPLRPLHRVNCRHATERPRGRLRAPAGVVQGLTLSQRSTGRLNKQTAQRRTISREKSTAIAVLRLRPSSFRCAHTHTHTQSYLHLSFSTHFPTTPWNKVYVSHSSITIRHNSRYSRSLLLPMGPTLIWRPTVRIAGHVGAVEHVKCISQSLRQVGDNRASTMKQCTLT